ncbi:MAG: LPS export ABC transporter periplasmic protein LptC [Deltaproteobacteria bacterium]|nr:LPS export ABC transporter periplasmic protein LptC [Deltaproteobacteria bacterium]
MLGLKTIKKLSIVLVLVMLVTIGIVAAVFIGYRRVVSAPELLLSSIKEGANLSLGKIRQTATRDGKKEWSLEAGSAHYVENEKKAVLKDLSITYFLKDNREIYLEAEEGILQTDTNDIEFSGNVVIRNEDYQLRTRRLSYEHERRLIFSNDPVQVSGESVNLSARLLKYDLNLNKLLLSGNIEATISRGSEAINQIGGRRQ